MNNLDIFREQMSQLSEAELKDKALTLSEEIEDIDLQLKEDYDVYGDDAPYVRKGWRRAAKKAKRYKQAERNCIQGMLSHREAC